jgi:hypothetical protein
MINFAKVISIMLVCLIFCLSTFAQNDCEKILENGLYEHLKITRANAFSSDFRTYLLSDTFKFDLKNGKWGGSITVPIEGVPVSLGANASEDEKNVFHQKIMQATNFSISKADYETIFSSIPNVNLGKVYNECIAIQINRIWRVVASFGENWASFEIKYNPPVSTDPMPKVQLINVINGTVTNTRLKLNETISNSENVATDRDPKKDLILSVQTDRGSVTYKIPADAEPEMAKDMPVGTIITSYLNVDQFYLATKNNEKSPGGIWTSGKSKWCPADGRIIPGSIFGRIASQSNVPDLRGMFLRGLNVMEAAPQIPLSVDRRDPDDRTVGTYQQDSFRSHSHPIGREPWINGSSGASGNGIGLRENNTGASGGAETRPKNIAVYYYIRIN